VLALSRLENFDIISFAALHKRLSLASFALVPAGKIGVMTTPQFVHLRLHSEFSIADGLVRIDQAIQAAVEDQQPALAVTDLANLFGNDCLIRSLTP